MELNELELLWNAADIEEKENRKLVQDFIQGMTDKKIKVCSSFCTREISISVDFVDENNKDVFGTRFDLYYRSEYDYDKECYGPRTLSLCHGTIGSYTRDSDPYQIDRLKLMTTIWDNENKLTSFLDNLDFSKTREANKAQKEYEKEQRELKEKADEEKRKNIISSLAVGYKFEDNYLEDVMKVKYEITKLTSKRVYVNFTTISPNQSYKYDDNHKYIGKSYGNVIKKNTGYIKYEDLVHNLVYNIRNYNSIMGKKYITSDFIEERFEPLN